MKLPEKVLIDDVEYSLRKCGLEELQIESENFDDVFGLTDYKPSQIDICEGMSDSQTKVTLMHEIIHAILHERGFDNASNDESLVDGLAHALRMLAKQNPELIKEILL